MEIYQRSCKDLVSHGNIQDRFNEISRIEAELKALNFAVIRGDVEIVKILLENGADPYVENDLGMNAFELSEKAGPFPSVQRVLREHHGNRA